MAEASCCAIGLPASSVDKPAATSFTTTVEMLGIRSSNSSAAMSARYPTRNPCVFVAMMPRTLVSTK